jgi:hypothetical protein
MDFNQYYLDQADGIYDGDFENVSFRGPMFQRGFGIGSYFRSFFSWALPLLKKHALPIAQSVGKEVVRNAASVASEAIDGRDLKESVEEKVMQTLEKLKKNQIGRGLEEDENEEDIIEIDMQQMNQNREYENQQIAFINQQNQALENKTQPQEIFIKQTQSPQEIIKTQPPINNFQSQTINTPQLQVQQQQQGEGIKRKNSQNDSKSEKRRRQNDIFDKLQQAIKNV